MIAFCCHDDPKHSRCRTWLGNLGVSLSNPAVYLVSGFRRSFYSIADVSPAFSLFMTLVFLTIYLAILAWIFSTGGRSKT